MKYGGIVRTGILIFLTRLMQKEPRKRLVNTAIA